jgi:hypothetical protein
MKVLKQFVMIKSFWLEKDSYGLLGCRLYEYGVTEDIASGEEAHA